MRRAHRARRGRERRAPGRSPPCACADDKPTPGDWGAGFAARFREGARVGQQRRPEADSVMAGSGSTWPSGKPLFKVVLMVLVALILHSASSEHPRDFVPPHQQKREVPVDLLTQIGRSVRGTLDAWIGPETVHLVSETMSHLMWGISSWISVAFFALSGITAQLLNALGLDGDHLTQVLQLSPSQVQTFLLWGAGALVIYWLLSLVLGLVLALLGRILWGLKFVIFLVGFVALVRSVPDPSTRALFLLVLLTVYALVSRITGSRASGAQLEAKVRSLERQVEEMRWRQRRVAKGTRGMEEE